MPRPDQTLSGRLAHLGEECSELAAIIFKLTRYDLRSQQDEAKVADANLRFEDELVDVLGCLIDPVVRHHTTGRTLHAALARWCERHPEAANRDFDAMYAIIGHVGGGSAE
jgi:hypothetical protein